MASNILFNQGSRTVCSVFPLPRIRSKVSQFRPSQMLRGQRAASSPVYTGESKIRQLSIARLRSSSSAQINPTFESNFKTVMPSYLLNCSSRVKNFSVLSNRLFFRNFHNVKRNPLKGNSVVNKRQLHRDESIHDSTAPKYFRTAAATTAFVFASFAFSDVWHVVIGVGKDLMQQIMKTNRINLSDHSIAQYLIIGVNVGVFCLWKISRFRNTMVHYAMVSKNSGFSQKLFASFSHSNFLHIFLNLYVFTSFAKAWEEFSAVNRHKLPRDVLSADKFLSFYLCAGIVASTGSWLIQNLTKASFRSLGASGAILGLFGYVCCRMPDGQLSIAFLPQFSFSAKNGMIGLATFDTVGLLVGVFSKWRYMIFDHAAHLSGLLFGIWYANYGEAFLYKWTKYVRSKR